MKAGNTTRAVSVKTHKREAVDLNIDILLITIVFQKIIRKREIWLSARPDFGHLK